MMFRTVAATLLLATSVATAQPAGDLALAPVCAELDLERDVLSPAERSVALQQLTRSLQDSDALVVERGCTEHYVLSHEHDGADFIVRLLGPAGVRRVRNPDRSKLPAVYERLVTALLDAQEQTEARLAQEEAAETARRAQAELTAAASNTAQPSVAMVEQSDATHSEATEAEPVVDAVPPGTKDVLIYGQLHAGTLGSGFGAGLRIPVTRAAAIDLSATGGVELVELSAKLLGFRFPDASSSSYFGGGVGMANEEHEGMSGSGPRFHGTAGYAFNRMGSMRMFVQLDLAIPLYEVGDSHGSPTVMLAIGAGGGKRM